MAFLVYKGSFAAAGSAQSITGVGFTPTGLFIFAAPDAPAAFDTFGDGYQISLGYGIAGSLTSRTGAVVGRDNVATSDLWNVIDTNEPFQAIGDAGGGTMYTRRGGRVDSFDADGFTVSWNINPAGDYEGKVFHYLAFGGDFVITAPSGEEPSGTSSPETYNPMGAYRLRSLPVAQILVESSNTTAFVLQEGTLGIGLAGNLLGAYTQGAVAVASLTGANPSSTYRYQKAGRCSLGLNPTTGAVRREGVVSAFSAHVEVGGADDGLFHGQADYTWPTTGTGEVHDFTIGGGLDDLDGLGLRAVVVPVTQPAATGLQTFSGLGLAPVAVLVIGAGGVASTSVEHATLGLTIGASDGMRQGVVWSGDTTGVSPTVTASRHSESAVILSGTPAASGASSTLTGQASVESLISTGAVVLDWTVTDGTAREYLMLVLGTDPPPSQHNLLTGSTHTVDGGNNLIAGANGTVTGEKNVLFALCDGSPAPSIVGDNTFKVCADTIDLSASSVTVNGGALVIGPGSSTDKALVRFDGTGGGTLQNSLITVSDAGALGLPDGVRQTFNPDATNAGLNVGSVAGDPSSPSNGDLWYDSTAHELTARINGASVALGSGGGGALNDLSDVTVGSPLSDGDVLTYDLGSGLWLNTAPSAVGGGTSTGAYSSLPAAGTAGTLYLCTDSPYLLRDNGATWDAFIPGVGPVTLPVDGDFAWLNQGSAAVAVVGGAVVLTGDTTSFRSRIKSATAPYVITAWFEPPALNRSADAFGLLFRDSAGGKVKYFSQGTDGNTGVFIYNFSDATTWNGTDLSVLRTGWIRGMRIADNNTDRKYYLSQDGQNWQEVYSETRTTYLTANQVGFFGRSDSTGGTAKIILQSWVEA